MASQIERPILTIGELTRYIKARIDTDPFLQQCYIRGEISNFTRHSSGHLYFTLKDDASRIKAVMFKGSARFLPFIPKDGMKVIARGNVSVFERDGSYQFYADELQPDGLGALHLAYEQMKQRLEAEGLFSPARKRPLPKFPAAIGVITSPTGAAVRDIITTIQRRYPIAHVILYPVLVQGSGAAASVAHAIQEMNRLNEVELLIVGRGGGSLEELWSFNEEIVARAIYDSQLPVISAVGHETDFTIADFVADVRAATPTAAAELAVPVFAELTKQVAECCSRLTQRIRSIVTEERRHMDNLLSRRSLTHPMHTIDRKRELLDHSVRNLELALTKRAANAKTRVQEWSLRLQSQSPASRIQMLSERLDNMKSRAISASVRKLTAEQNRFENLLIGLEAYSPLSAMKRGYALVYEAADKNRKPGKKGPPRLVRKIQDVNLGDIVSVRLQNGWLECQVWGIKEEKLDDESKSDGQDTSVGRVAPSA